MDLQLNLFFIIISILTIIYIIRKIRKHKLNIDDSIVQGLIKSPPAKDYDLPKDEVRKYIYLDDILNLIAVDGEIHDNEIIKSKELAKKLGFDELIIDSIISKIKSHIKSGFDKNNSSEIIKFDIYSLTQTTDKYEKYNK